jgi:hypothetical protein
MESEMNIDPPVGEESLERPEKRRKIEETADDVEAAPGTLGGLERGNAMEVERQYNSGGEEDPTEETKDVTGTDSRASELQDRSGLLWDDEGYPILTENWAGVKKEFLVTKPQLLAIQNQVFLPSNTFFTSQFYILYRTELFSTFFIFKFLASSI